MSDIILILIGIVGVVVGCFTEAFKSAIPQHLAILVNFWWVIPLFVLSYFIYRHWRIFAVHLGKFLLSFKIPFPNDNSMAREWAQKQNFPPLLKYKLLEAVRSGNGEFAFDPEDASLKELIIHSWITIGKPTINPWKFFRVTQQAQDFISANLVIFTPTQEQVQKWLVKDESLIEDLFQTISRIPGMKKKIDKLTQDEIDKTAPNYYSITNRKILTRLAYDEDWNS